MTPDFAPQIVRKNSGIIYVGIQYSGVDSGVKMTPDLMNTKIVVHRKASKIT